jgi:hypothetical protein
MDDQSLLHGLVRSFTVSSSMSNQKLPAWNVIMFCMNKSICQIGFVQEQSSQ